MTEHAPSIISFDAKSKDFKSWASFFHENGYVIINNALSNEMIQKLHVDLNKVNKDSEKYNNKKTTNTHYVNKHVVHKRFFETSRATVDLVEDSLLTDFAQYLISDVTGLERKGNSLTAHLVHNNAFIIPPNGRGQASSWHTDDPLQQVVIPEGKTLPKWIKLPVLVATYMIWLSDCDTPEKGPTCIVPGSHRWGCVVDAEKAEKMYISACGKAGTAVLVNSQTWHRGSENKSSTPRETLQLTYGRRIIGHKHGTIMNYVMPAHVIKNRSDKTKERFGFLQGGAYS
jgi:ectoine hydroxylase-related dioxygenase (phytanoyl-CoA dioxygenase family)